MSSQFDLIPSNDRGLAGLQVVHAGLPVEMIMTPRPFFSCHPSETCANVKARNTDRFSFVPVMDRDRILGLLDARPLFNEASPKGAVSDHYKPLSEEMLIGADASIWEFIRTADTPGKETRLVVKGHSVAGLVTLSDMHKLPVRTALFAALTNLEVCMTTLIEKRLGDHLEAWSHHLNDKRLKSLKSHEQQARKNDQFINHLLLTQLCDKREIIIRARLLDLPVSTLRSDFESVERLRNFIAHSNDFAKDDPMAHEVCRTARSIETLIKTIQRTIAEHDRDDGVQEMTG